MTQVLSRHSNASGDTSRQRGSFVAPLLSLVAPTAIASPTPAPMLTTVKIWCFPSSACISGKSQASYESSISDPIAGSPKVSSSPKVNATEGTNRGWL